MTGLRRPRHATVRVYQQVRTAHLERARRTAPATIVYGERRYDFDPALAAGLDLIPAGPLRTLALVALSPIRTLEVNEPAQLPGIARTAAVVLVARLGGLVRHRRPRIVAYAIANLDETARPAPRLRSRVRRAGERALSRWLAGQVDRLAFGTEGARSLYRDLYGRRVERAEQALVPALPRACDCPQVTRDEHTLLFLGALAPRKGVPLLLRAWPRVRELLPQARLTVVGTGPLTEQVAALATDDDSVTFLHDPPRAEVHRRLRSATALVLLSQRTPTWREQVGLPLVEALAHGCTVVTTTETGLADTLAAAGHHVLDPGADPDEIARACAAALRSPLDPQQVLAALPEVDGRDAADAWLVRDADDDGGPGDRRRAR